ncbi:MAG: DUF4097 family beta strand repeat protein [Xanthomonadales bacterium]|nr:DUF4097 family beta strand repeat protein [Xanthomonadales bacterium]
MKFHRMTMTAMAGLLALAAPLSTLGGMEIDETLEMPADGLVQVENLAGSVEFATWDRSEAQIRGEAGKDVEDVEISATSNGIQIRVKNPKNRRRVDGTDLYLRVPEQASIEADGVSTDITVNGGSGDSIMLSTVSGDLEVEASPARVELTTVSGDIELEGEVMRSTLESVSGDVTVDGLAGEINLSTVSGDVSLEGGEASRGRFESVSGEMTLSLSVSDGGRLNCDSMSGDITLMLPASQQADFGAQSYSGDIRTDFGESVSVSRGPGTVLEHAAGDNGAKIRLESFSGDIAIRRQ